MKKAVLLFSCLCVQLFAAAAERNATVLQLDMKKEQFLSVLGEPNRIAVIEREKKPLVQSSDWDWLDYEYDGLDICFYRVVDAVELLLVYSDTYEIDVDGNKIRCGESRKEIEDKIGAGTYDGKDKTKNEWNYYYDLWDLRTLTISYNAEDRAVCIVYGYVY